MIRITITQIKDPRARCTKAIAVADIEVVDQLGLWEQPKTRTFEVRVRHNPPLQDRVRWQARLEGFNPVNASHWHLIHAALSAVLPQAPIDDATLGAPPAQPGADSPRPADGSH
jgi:hypothetical protein